MPRVRPQNASALSRFFLLYPDAFASNLESVESYGFQEFDIMALWTGEKCEGGINGDYSIQMSKGEVADCLGNPMSWLIWSKQCADVLDKSICDHVQIIPLQVKIADGSVTSDRYRIINPLVVLDAIYSTRKRKDRIALADIVVDAEKVPDDVNIFRLKYSETTVVVRDKIVQIVQKNQLKGFAASPLDLH